MLNDIKKSTFVALPLLMLVFISACKKTPPENPQQEILTIGSWRMTEYMNYTLTASTDVYASYAACEKDDLYVFNENGRLDINEGPSKCDVNGPSGRSVLWEFSNGRHTHIKIDGTEYIITRYDNAFELSTCFYNGCGVDWVKISYTR